MHANKLGRKLGIAAAVALAAMLSGCVAYPEGGAYYPAPYYSPGYVVAAPPVGVGGYWGGGYRGGYGGGWGHGRGWR